MTKCPITLNDPANMLGRKLSIQSLLAVSALILCLSMACAESPASPPHTPTTKFAETGPVSNSPTLVRPSPVSGVESAEVSRIVDGDTIKVILGGKLQTIRYIGVDTPETKHPNKPIDCFGPEASRFNQKLVFGKRVILEKDITDRDRYGRLLRYVWVEGVGLVNQVLVENGYARVSSFPPDVKYEYILLSAESVAQENKTGLWSACSEPSINEDSVVPAADSSGDNCSPSYPTICIPPPPPDLDCSDINGNSFLVLPPDLHRLDGDKDGTGCEG